VTTLTAPPPSLREAVARGPLDGGGATLLERLELALAGASAEGSATCPVCEGPMAPAGKAARCQDCGAELS
jgi:tRNA(Ile2) C34 agmatinyltransferase TiaS